MTERMFGTHIREAIDAFKSMGQSYSQQCCVDSHYFPPMIGDPMPLELFVGMKCACGSKTLQLHKCECGHVHLRVTP
jgi:hypothetical protein